MYKNKEKKVKKGKFFSERKKLPKKKISFGFFQIFYLFLFRISL